MEKGFRSEKPQGCESNRIRSPEFIYSTYTSYKSQLKLTLLEKWDLAIEFREGKKYITKGDKLVILQRNYYFLN